MIWNFNFWWRPLGRIVVYLYLSFNGKLISGFLASSLADFQLLHSRLSVFISTRLVSSRFISPFYPFEAPLGPSRQAFNFASPRTMCCIFSPINGGLEIGIKSYYITWNSWRLSHYRARQLAGSDLCVFQRITVNFKRRNNKQKFEKFGWKNLKAEMLLSRSILWLMIWREPKQEKYSNQQLQREKNKFLRFAVVPNLEPTFVLCSKITRQRTRRRPRKRGWHCATWSGSESCAIVWSVLREEKDFSFWSKQHKKLALLVREAHSSSPSSFKGVAVAVLAWDFPPVVLQQPNQQQQQQPLDSMIARRMFV